MLPRVKILFTNGALAQVVPSPDGVLGHLFTGGLAVTNKFDLNTAYVIRKFEDLETNLGITEENNPQIVKYFTDFYAMAGAGAEAWLMAFADTLSLADMLDVTEVDNAKALILAANGRLRGLIATRTPAEGYEPSTVNGLDIDVFNAMVNAQALAQWATESLMAPLFVAIEGRNYTGDPIDLTDQTESEYNRCLIFIGDTVSDSGNACMGMLAGRISAIPVQRNIGRVKDGPISTLLAYIKDIKVESADPESIHDKGYVTLRTFVGRNGYFFTDDIQCTLPSDDYRSLTARRTADKAYRIAYLTLLEELLDEIQVNEDGTMQHTQVKAWQAMVENAIALQMTANGELSADVTNPNDRGVVCYIDATQNVVSTSKINITVKIRPFGYARYIDVYLGFTTITV